MKQYIIAGILSVVGLAGVSTIAITLALPDKPIPVEVVNMPAASVGLPSVDDVQFKADEAAHFAEQARIRSITNPRLLELLGRAK